jgi:S1-C subfamily serine protease
MWLGMEIITAPQGIPVVETVRPYSNGDRAGLEPADQIVLVNNHAVGSTGSISDAIKGLHSGDKVTMEVNSGGAILTLVATLAAPPAPYP